MEISKWLSIPLQGLAEGTTVGIMALFITDLYLDKKTKKYSYFMFGTLVILITLIMFSHGIYIPNIGGDVPSRRDVFPIWELMLIPLMIPVLIWILKSNKETRRRGFTMFITMFILGCIWYLMYWLSGQRWAEIGIKNPDDTYSNLVRAPPLIELFTILYNALVK